MEKLTIVLILLSILGLSLLLINSNQKTEEKAKIVFAELPDGSISCVTTADTISEFRAKQKLLSDANLPTYKECN